VVRLTKHSLHVIGSGKEIRNLTLCGLLMPSLARTIAVSVGYGGKLEGTGDMRRPNPMAKDLRQKKYRPRVVPDKKKPILHRKRKHKDKTDETRRD